MRYDETRHVWTSVGTREEPGTLTQGGALIPPLPDK